MKIRLLSEVTEHGDSTLQPTSSRENTVTQALTRLDNRHKLYQLMKVGPGRTAGYRMTTLSHVNTLRSTSSAVRETRRYNALHIVDRAPLADMLKPISQSCTWLKPRP
jgi:guanylate kinase